MSSQSLPQHQAEHPQRKERGAAMRDANAVCVVGAVFLALVVWGRLSEPGGYQALVPSTRTVMGGMPR